MQAEIKRLKGYLEQIPDLDIWIISKTKSCAELYWCKINECINTNKKPVFISKENCLKDGYTTYNAIILLCGQWYENPIANTDVFRMRMGDAKFTLPIVEIPYPTELDKSVKTLMIAEGQVKIMDSKVIIEDQIANLQELQVRIIKDATRIGLNSSEFASAACEVARTIEHLCEVHCRLYMGL